MAKTHDLVIVGAGSAGLTAAPFAVQLGARVALVERDRIGGDCTWTGCVPSKTLLKAAKLAHQIRNSAQFGLLQGEPQIDFKIVMRHVQKVVNNIYQTTSPESLCQKGIDVFLGKPHFLDARTLSVNGETITAPKIILCTGAHPYIPPVSGLESVKYLTYQSIWNLEALPRRLIVVGAGPIGCELAQAFCRLGAKVTLIEASERLSDEPEVARVISGVFSQEGIDTRPGTSVDRAWQDKKGIHVDASGDEIKGDTLLIAVGRRPNVDNLNLEKAGVEYTKDGIHVDDYLRTTQPGIYAAGDCAGSLQFSHYAGWQGFMAVRNALLPGKHKGFSEYVPWCTFTDPEVAHVGLTEAQAREKVGSDILTYEWPMEKVDRALNEAESVGFLKLVYHRRGIILGVTIVAAQAGEMINEWVVAIKEGFKIDELARAIHVYPSYSMATMSATAAIKINRLMSGLSGKIIRRLARVSR